eukprot:scaffold5.g956.t1
MGFAVSPDFLSGFSPRKTVETQSIDDLNKSGMRKHACSGHTPAFGLALERLQGRGGAASAARARAAAPAARRRVHRLRVAAAQQDQEDDLVPSGSPLLPALPADPSEARGAVEAWLNPPPEELPDALEMPIWDHLDELRERVLVAALAAAVAVLGCFCFSKDLVVFLEAPVAAQGVRFLQLSPGEFFFTTLKASSVGGYAGLLIAVPTMLYEVAAYVVPGLTRSERRFLAPVIFGSSILFYLGLVFSYEILTPAALTFFVSYADGAVESLWSIDQYFEFVLVLMLSTGLAFQASKRCCFLPGLCCSWSVVPDFAPRRSVRRRLPSRGLAPAAQARAARVPVIQLMLGGLGLVSSEAMFAQWRWVVVGATIAAAVLTPSTDPFTQTLLALPLVGLYFGGAGMVRLLEQRRAAQAQ